MIRMRILLVAGMPGAGKEELLGVARSIGIPFLRMGDIVREHHAESGTVLSVGAYANAQREELGKDIWARRALERMHGDIFLVDGCRSMDEVRSYRGLSDDVLIVGIFAPPEARFERLRLGGQLLVGHFFVFGFQVQHFLLQRLYALQLSCGIVAKKQFCKGCHMFSPQ